AEQNFHAGGVGASDENLFGGWFDGQDVVLVLEQNDGLSSGAISQLAMRVTGDHVSGGGGIGDVFLRIEHAELEACAQGALQGTIHQGFGCFAASNGGGDMLVDVVTAEVAAVL